MIRLATFLLLGIAACAEPGTPTVLLITALEGSPQTAPVATTLPVPLVAQVTRDGAPAPGVEVRWTAEHGSVEEALTRTDAQGRTATRWTLGTATGRQVARAALAASTEGGRAEFEAVAEPGPLVHFSIGDTLRRVMAGSTTTIHLTATDAYGNSIAVAAAAWTSSDAAVVAVEPDGRARALRRGSARVTATLQQLTAGARFEVFDALFASGPQLPLASDRHMEARAADVDGDGDLDLVIAREFQPNALLLNQGNGTFISANDRIPQKVRDSEDIAIADFDGDGDLDIVIVSEDDAANPQIELVHEYYLNDGTGRFTDVSERIPVRSESNAVAAGDIDGDGDIDLILSNTGREIVLLNDGTGHFTDASVQRMPAASDGTQDVVLADVDGDGDLDLIVANDSGHPNQLYLNDGAGFFTSAPAGSLPFRPAEITRNADLADVDGDGDLDLFFSNATYGGGNPQDRLLLNDGSGRFTDRTGANLPAILHATFDAEFLDIDGDGDVDIVSAGGGAGGQGGFVYMNDGTGRFTEVSQLVMPFIPGPIVIEVEVADFDGDGRADVLFSGYNAPHRLLLGR